jgi:dTDP-4-dehydrorhamnose reductase
MRTVITGGSGLLAAAVARAFGTAGDVLPLSRAALDVGDAGAVERTIASARPDVVINCAAFNDVDGAEEEAEAALRTNALALLGLARAARAAGALLVHYSTDFVFDGTATRPYRETDAPNPKGVYGASKLLGEWFALEHPRAYVLRVESLFGEPGPSTARAGSLGTMVRRIRAREAVPVFVDRTVSPGYTADIARATRALVAGGAPFGLYHCVNSGAATWAEIAAEAARLLAVPIDITPLTLETARLKAPRPRYCALSNAKLAAAGIPMPTWQEALGRYLGG